jgi:hypothetical protein
MIVFLLVASTLCCYAVSQDSELDRTKLGSLIAKINWVTVLELNTDTPIAHYRLLVDSKTVEEQRIYENFSNHVYLAVVPGNSPLGNGSYFHMKIGNANCMLSAPSFKMGPDNNIQSTIEYTFPDKKASIGDWTTIYSIKVVEIEKVIRTIEVQIKGTQPPNPPYSSPANAGSKR